ncbi:MAG: vWA domain-containing protein [Symbiobacteriia bacterium]
MSETIQLKAVLSRNRLPAETGGKVYLLLQLAAPARAQAGEGEPGGADSSRRLPLNLAAVLDRSGSMEGAKLTYTRKAASFLIEQMDAPDYLSVVTYDDEVQLLQPAAHITNRDLLKADVQAIRTGGSTNLSGGTLAGAREVRRHRSKERVNRVLLLTDGLANVGLTRREGLVEMAGQVRSAGILLTTLGVGDDFDEDLLTAMAEAGGGNFYYIANPDQIPAIFAQELEGLLAVAGQSLALSLAAAPGVTIQGVLGYPPTGTPQATLITLPDIYAGETKSLVLELDVAPGPVGSRPLLRVDFGYDDLLAGCGAVNMRLDVWASVEDAAALEGVQDDPDVLKQAHLARSAQALEEAIDLADRQDFERGSQVLAEMAAALESVGGADESVSQQIHALREKAAEYKAGHYDAASRKQMRMMSNQTRSGRRQK